MGTYFLYIFGVLEDQLKLQEISSTSDWEKKYNEDFKVLGNHATYMTLLSNVHLFSVGPKNITTGCPNLVHRDSH